MKAVWPVIYNIRMRTHEAIQRLETQLEGVDEPARDAYYIITEIMALRGEEAPLVTDVPEDVYAEALRVAARRARGEPLQYIFGRAYFMDTVLSVKPGVFIPRPETEVLVVVARSLFPPDASLRIWDVGTGSGCVAITLARHYASARVTASDTSEAALMVAGQNIASYGLADRIDLVPGPGLAPAQGEYDLVVSNPPYVRTEEMHDLSQEVLLEPTEALWGGDDGAVLSRELILGARLSGRGWLLLESSPYIAEAVASFARASGYSAEIIPDLSGFPRVIKAKRA